jgi:hypothetical protein
MANYVAALWEDVSVLDARFLNLVSWGWFVREGVCFSGVKGGSCTQWDMSKNMFYAASFFTSLLRTYLWIKRSVGLPRMDMKIWWLRQTVKILELFSSSFHFVFAARITRKGVVLLMNTAPSTVSQSANASDCHFLRVRFKSWAGHRLSWMIFVH